MFSHIGYQPKIIPVLINSGKESILQIKLEPQTIKLNEVIIKPEFQKEKPINKLVYSSGRSFSTEEAYRYAGTLGDPARMVRYYAGVAPERDDRNDIIIRGNSPTGILWRLDGIEIPNPNHYGGIGLTGNTTTLLNTNLLTNSDFITGAFPAEYSNALAGVFDLKMKKPNTDQYEYHFQSGWNGFELGVEGPVQHGSFLSVYRYSFLDVMSLLGIELGVIPKYQDFTAKADYNITKKLNISLIGLWGNSNIELDDHDQEKEDIKTVHGYNTNTGSKLVLGGFNLNYQISKSTRFKSGISAIYNIINTEIDTFNLNTDLSNAIWDETSKEIKYSLFSEIENNSLKNNYLKTGIRWDIYTINYKQNGINWNDVYSTIVNATEKMDLLRIYFQDEYHFNYKFKATVGINTQYLLYNNSFAIEPRLGLKYKPTNNQSLAFSYGNHHQMQPRTVYFIQTDVNSEVELTNKQLDFSAANHYVLSYNSLIDKNLRLKTDIYFQELYNIPIENDENSVFSMINTGANFYIPQKDSLVNKGKGRNYGIELTIEKFFNNNYYYMLNSTLFQSEYKGGDGIWRNTAFNTNYILNAVAGYEWWPVQNKAFGCDLSLTLAGGKPYVPVTEIESVNKKEVVFENEHAYEKRYNNYFRTDLKLFYRINYENFYTEFAIDFQNLTNYKSIYHKEFIPETGEYITYYNMEFYPMFTFKCFF